MQKSCSTTILVDSIHYMDGYWLRIALPGE